MNYLQPQHIDNIEQLHQQFISARGFPHIEINDFLQEDFLRAANRAFPAVDDMMYHYDSVFECGKHTSDLANPDLEHGIPADLLGVMQFMSSPAILRFFESLSGIEGLIPDPYFHGGGLHQSTRGGHLDVHIDFNRANELNLYRRLNVILYLNEHWNAEWGGNLELWTGHVREDGRHELLEQVANVSPRFNSIGVFATGERSYHGHPQPLGLPARQDP